MRISNMLISQNGPKNACKPLALDRRAAASPQFRNNSLDSRALFCPDFFWERGNSFELYFSISEAQDCQKPSELCSKLELRIQKLELMSSSREKLLFAFFHCENLVPFLTQDCPKLLSKLK